MITNLIGLSNKIIERKKKSFSKMQKIFELDKDPKNWKLINEITDNWNSHQFEIARAMSNSYRGHFVDNFIQVMEDKNNIGYYVCELLKIYASYLEHGIAFISFVEKKTDYKRMKKWCQLLFIKFKTVVVFVSMPSYCHTHQKRAYDPCEDYWMEENCDYEYDCKIPIKKIIIHDDVHKGTFDELHFQWDNRYVNGGYVPK
jgi:hypothetical protein